MHNRTLVSISELMQTPFRPHQCEVNGKKFPLMRLEIPIEVDDYLGWLEAQTLYPKFYWENPQDNMKVAAIGKVLEVDGVPTISAEGGPRFFGGVDFTSRRHKTWGAFPSSKYILPLIEIEERDGTTFLCINRTEETLPVELEDEGSLSEIAPPLSRLDSPSFPVWQRNIKELLGLISQGEVTKVVPARCTRFEFERELSPYSILKQLSSPSRFAFQFEKDQAFIGASPETLYRRDGRRVRSAAVAGTTLLGEDEALTTPKVMHEFNVVRESIEATLSSLCTELHSPDQGVLQTANIQHLHATFEGNLNKGISDHDLIAALHPTPAVGGEPKEAAIKEIQKREHFDRGWYAAPVGWVTHKQAHHLVAIRSALIDKNQLRLFAGAGIVKGSLPIDEWDELEQKISQYFLWNDK